MKCKAYGCINESHQGEFNGVFCSPCANALITANFSGPTTAEWGKLFQDREFLLEKVKLADDLIDAIRDHRLAKRTASGKWKDTDLAFNKTMAEYAEARRLTADKVNMALGKYINARKK